jgi:hypothetical protein
MWNVRALALSFEKRAEAEPKLDFSGLLTHLKVFGFLKQMSKETKPTLTANYPPFSVEEASLPEVIEERTSN